MSSSLADDFPLVLDVEDACGTDRSGTQSPYNSDGPRNLEDVLDGPRAAAIHAVQHARNDLNYLDRIRSFVECNMVVTSSLSGTGAFERQCLAARQDVAAALNDCGIPVKLGKFVVYSATESDSAAQTLLRSGGPVAPLHLFADVNDRLRDKDRKMLDEICADEIAVLKQSVMDQKRKLMSKEELKEAKASCSGRLLEVLTDALKQLDFHQSRECLICGKECYVNPRDAGYSAEEWVWWEGAGTVCKPFSSMSLDSADWCDPSTLCTLAWAITTRAMRPDRIIHECVTRFKEEVFAKIFKEEVPHKVKHGAFQSYDMKVSVFCPSDLGMPVRRPRKYCAFELLPIRFPPLGIRFRDLFFRQLVCSGKVFMIATKDELEFEQDNRGKKASGSEEANIGNGLMDRLDGFMAQAKRQKLCDSSGGNWKIDAGFVNPLQNIEFTSGVSTCVPTLLCKSRIFDLVACRELLVSEMWRAQGVAFPGRNLPTAVTPETNVVAVLSSVNNKSKNAISVTDQRRLVGNAMHAGQVTSWILYSV